MKNGNKINILKGIGNDLKWNYSLINAITASGKFGAFYNCNTNLYDLFI